MVLISRRRESRVSALVLTDPTLARSPGNPSTPVRGASWPRTQRGRAACWREVDGGFGRGYTARMSTCWPCVHIGVWRQRRRGVVCVVLALVCGLAGAQAALAASPPAPISAETAVSTGYDYAGSAALLSDGSAIITGRFDGATLALGGTVLTNANPGAPAAFVAKLRADRSWAWAKSPAGNGTVLVDCVSASSDGSAIITGSYDSTNLVFEGTTLTNPSAGFTEVFVAKLNADGAWAWAKNVVTAMNSGFGSCVSVLSDGSAIIAGSFTGANAVFGAVTLTNPNVFTNDAFVAKLNADGAWAWATNPTGTGGESAAGVSVLSDGSSIITGTYTSSSVLFGTTTLPDPGGSGVGVFVAKVSADGSWAWATSAVGGVTHTDVAGVSVAVDGSAIITGQFEALAMVFGADTLVGLTIDAFVAKVNADGSWVWAKSATSTRDDSGQSVSVLADGSAIITGNFYGDALAFGGGLTLTNSYTGLGHVAGSFVARVTADGSWASAWNPTSTTGLFRARSVSALPDGSVLTAGNFEGDVAFGGSIALTASDAANGDLFIAHFLDLPQAPNLPTAVVNGVSAAVSVAPLAGGSVVSYQVVSDTGGKACTIVVPATSCVVEGLVAGIAYRFRVAATNAVGTGLASSWSESVLAPITPNPSTAPTAPTAPTRIRWSQPTQSVRVGQVLLATFTAAADSTYMITATPSTAGRGGARAAKVVRGTCRIKTKQQRRMATCTIRLRRPGRWLVSITPVRMGVTGTPATTRVRVNAPAPALPAEPVTG